MAAMAVPGDRGEVVTDRALANAIEALIPAAYTTGQYENKRVECTTDA